MSELPTELAELFAAERAAPVTDAIARAAVRAKLAAVVGAAPLGVAVGLGLAGKALAILALAIGASAATKAVIGEAPVSEVRAGDPGEAYFDPSMAAVVAAMDASAPVPPELRPRIPSVLAPAASTDASSTLDARLSALPKSDAVTTPTGEPLLSPRLAASRSALAVAVPQVSPALPNSTAMVASGGSEPSTPPRSTVPTAVASSLPKSNDNSSPPVAAIAGGDSTSRTSALTSLASARPKSDAVGTPAMAEGADAVASTPTEVQLLRDAWATSDPAHGLALVHEDARLYPRGALAEERDALEIRALAGLGRLAEARSIAAQFFVHYPNTVHRTLVASALGKATP